MILSLLVLAATATAPELVGKPAPQFVLPTDRGTEFSLKTYKGKQNLVLAFFPKAFTPGCEKEMTAFGKDLKKFHDVGAEVVGISYDDAQKQHDFAVHCAANFPFLSDDGKVAQLFGAAKSLLGARMPGRRTVLVDKAGVVRFVYDGMPDNGQLLKDLGSLATPAKP